MESIELLTCILLLSVSGYMSSSEIALFSLSRFQIRAIRDRARSAHKKIKRLLSDPGGLLITILMANEFVNITLSAIIADVTSRSRKTYIGPISALPDWAVDTLLGTLATAPVLLFLGEITPKVVGARANQLIATLAVGPLHFIYDLFKPLRLIFKKLLSIFSAKQSPHETPGETILKEADFMLMVEEGHKEGTIQESELGLIRNVFELDDTKVSEVFTPLLQVKTIASTSTLKAALGSIRNSHYARIPVVGTDKRQIVGILYCKDLLKAKLQPESLNLPVAEIMRKPTFVTPEMRLNDVFRRFKQNKTHLAVVQGPGGTTLGIVTMMDIFDSLFEDLFPEPEFDEELTDEPPGRPS